MLDKNVFCFSFLWLQLSRTCFAFVSSRLLFQVFNSPRYIIEGSNVGQFYFSPFIRDDHHSIFSRSKRNRDEDFQEKICQMGSQNLIVTDWFIYVILAAARDPSRIFGLVLNNANPLPSDFQNNWISNQSHSVWVVSNLTFILRIWLCFLFCNTWKLLIQVIMPPDLTGLLGVKENQKTLQRTRNEFITRKQAVNCFTCAKYRTPDVIIYSYGWKEKSK